jgi:hypothetical protein
LRDDQTGNWSQLPAQGFEPDALSPKHSGDFATESGSTGVLNEHLQGDQAGGATGHSLH